MLTAKLTGEDFASQAGHWYKPNGQPAYSIIGKNGKERSTTLRDARELGLYPSVTAILKIEAAPALENWKVNQALLAAMTLPRIEGESADNFMKRALDDSRQQARRASERGSYLHGLLERMVKNRDPPDEVTINDFAIIHPCLAWLDTHFPGYTWHPERSFACTHGFGGKLDLYGEREGEAVVIDWKFKDDIIPGKRLAYDNNSTQLAAYANGLDRPQARCFNLFASSSVPGLIVPYEWSAAEISCGWDVFTHLLAIWKLRRGL
jgi:hypothetical protein